LPEHLMIRVQGEDGAAHRHQHPGSHRQHHLANPRKSDHHPAGPNLVVPISGHNHRAGSHHHHAGSHHHHASSHRLRAMVCSPPVEVPHRQWRGLPLAAQVAATIACTSRTKRCPPAPSAHQSQPAAACRALPGRLVLPSSVPEGPLLVVSLWPAMVCRRAGMLPARPLPKPGTGCAVSRMLMTLCL